MGILLRAENFDVSGREFTPLALASAVNDTTITVDSTDGFVADDYIVVGEVGQEGTEIVKITSISSTTGMVVAALSYAHAVDCPIRKTPYNQVRFYRSATETGTYSIIATKNMDMDNKFRETNYDDTSGTTSLWYKFTYINSTTNDETAVTDSTAFEGANILYCTVKDVYDLLDMNEDHTNAPLTSQIQLLIESRSTQFENETGSFFLPRNVGSATDYKYVDGKGIFQEILFLGFAPIISITEISTTLTSPNATASWNALTEGRDNDYILHKEMGAAEIVNSARVPEEQPNSLRWYGVVGYASVPNDVRVVIAKGVSTDLAKSNQFKNIISGREGFDPERLIRWRKAWEEVVEDYVVDQFFLG